MANIFFGILSDSHISNNIDKWMSIAGAPAIFSERDDHIKKYQTKLLGEYDVVSLDEALRRYPDADVWVTYQRPGYIPSMLAEKLPPQRIRFLEADLEYRKGCGYLGNHILYRENSFSPCCSVGQGPRVKTSGPIRYRLAQWQEYTAKLVDDVRHERPNDCKKCHLLKDGFWRNSVKLNRFTFGVFNRSNICNFKCIYCQFKKPASTLPNAVDGDSVYEVLQQLSEIPEFNTEELAIQFGNGEFCANKHCDDILDIFLKTTWKMILFSNCSIYKEKLAALMANGRIHSLTTSIDAGTRETFKKIKQRDMFDRVIKNLKQYPVHKTILHVKYIFLDGVNDNETDIDGYYEIVKELDGIIMLSSSLLTQMTEKMRELALRIIKKAKKDGKKVYVDTVYVNAKDTKFINESYANA